MSNAKNDAMIHPGVSAVGATHAWVIDGIATQRQEVTKHRIDLVSNGSGGYRTQTTTTTSYDTRELLHCNFGWGHQADGYYVSKIFDTSQGPEEDDDDNPNNNTDPSGPCNTDY